MNHEPDPRFIEHLEWQTERALRRRDRFTRPSYNRTTAVARTLILILFCTLSGAGLVVAAEKIQVARQQELLLESNRVELALARRRVDRASEGVQAAEARHGAGMTDELQVQSARHAYEFSLWRVQRLQLDRVEIEVSGRAPDLSITADLVGGRDLLTERIELERGLDRTQLDMATRHHALTEQRYASGVVMKSEVDRASLDVGIHEAKLHAKQVTLAIREQWLNGELTDDQARRHRRLAAIDADREASRRELEFHELELARTRHLSESGRMSATELRKVEDRLEEVKAKLELLAFERELVEEGE